MQVRKRPLNKKEMAKKEEDIITIQSNSNALMVHEKKLKVDLTEYVEKHEFLFDAVLNEYVGNEEVYSETVEPIVPLIFNRTKATCFAYGQTVKDIYYAVTASKASQDIEINAHSYRNQGFQLFHNSPITDSDSTFCRKLFVREDGKQQVCIVGLQEYQLVIKRSADGSEKKPARLVGKLSFIDLAGSERGADTTDNDKQTRMKSLSKGNNSKKDTVSSSSNLRESTALPSASSLATDTFEDTITVVPPEKNRHVWSDRIERDASPFKVERVPSGRAEGNLAVVYSEENRVDPSMLDDKYSNSEDDLNALMTDKTGVLFLPTVLDGSS
ncbi:ATP binding microtubule motor family protein isoform 4 [Hibiscus syriacus]|uniref:Kinesin-like protein n=1 Tax=Hibiscus syriacus TaxID=106335 RepID=A0A6A2X353_HIBSY|nr:ATP binding microtubule motor family protein isoform 4 [Hibiscus syriacus]